MKVSTSWKNVSSYERKRSTSEKLCDSRLESERGTLESRLKVCSIPTTTFREDPNVWNRTDKTTKLLIVLRFPMVRKGVRYMRPSSGKKKKFWCTPNHHSSLVSNPLLDALMDKKTRILLSKINLYRGHSTKVLGLKIKELL